MIKKQVKDDLDGCKVKSFIELRSLSEIMYKVKLILTELSINPIGLFFNNEITPFLLYNDNHMNISNKAMLVDFVKNRRITIHDTLSLTSGNYRYISKCINDVPSITGILKFIFHYMESYYMLNIHSESNIVKKDIFNISDRFILVNKSAIVYHNVTDYIRSLTYLNDNAVYLMVEIFDLVINEVKRTLDMEDDSTIRIKSNGCSLGIYLYNSPSSRRYLLNEELYLMDQSTGTVVNEVSEQHLSDNTFENSEEFAKMINNALVSYEGKVKIENRPLYEEDNFGYA